MSEQRTRFSTNRRQVIGSLAAGAVVLGTGAGRRVAAQDASPAASPAAAAAAPEFRPSVVAERASGNVRVTGFAGPEEQVVLNEVFARFAERYPNITVTYEPVAAEYLTKIQTDIAANNAADIFMVQNEYAQDFMSRDVLLAVNDYMAEDGVTADEFFTPLIDAYTWNDLLYGLPKDWSPIGAVYDPEVFASAGVEFPTTWEELRTVLQTLKDTTGTVGLAIDPSFDRYVIFLYQAGGNILNEDESEILLGSPEATTALEYEYGLYADGLTSPAADIGGQWPGDAFAQGLAPMVFEGNWMFPFLQTNAPDKQYAVAELPAGPAGKGTPAFTNSYSIFAGSQNPDAAWVVVNYLTSYEAAQLTNELGLAIPARRDLEPEYLALFPERAPYLAAGEYATAVQYGPGGQAFAADANAALQSLWAGQIDTAAAQQQMVEAAEANIDLAD